VGGLRRAFLGRDAELEQLRRAYAKTVERAQPQLVTIVGDAGVGKSRLIEAFSNELERRSPKPVLHSGRCLP
jgi:Cdc6-like AAA superfamily ATPase